MANEDKATRYHRLQRRASLASTAVGALGLILLLVSGGAVWLRDVVVGEAGRTSALSVAAYIVAVALLGEGIQLPFCVLPGRDAREALRTVDRTAGPVVAGSSQGPCDWPGLRGRGSTGRLVAASMDARVLVAGCRRGVHRDARRHGTARAGAAPAGVLHLQAARSSGARRPLDRAGQARRCAGHGCVRMAAERSHAQGQCGACRDWPYAAHPAVGHAARRPLGRRDRGDSRARARSSRASRHLVGHWRSKPC